MAFAAAITPGLTFFVPRAPTPVFLFVVLIGLGVLLWRKERPAPIDKGLVTILALLSAWTALSIIWAPDLYFSARGFFKLTGNILLGVLLLAVARRANASERLLVGQFAVAGFIPPLVILSVEVVFDAPIIRAIWGGLPASEGFLQSLEYYGQYWVNACASVTVVFIWPTIAILLRARREILAAGLFIVTVLVIVGIDFETGAMALGIGIVTMGLVYWLRRNGVVTLAVVLVAMIVAAPFLTATVFTPRAIAQLTDSVPFSALHRIHIWQFTEKHIAEHPVRGWGMNASRLLPGGTQHAYDQFRNKEVGENMPLHPHNLPLQMWLELGFPGAVLLCALVSLILWRLTGAAWGRMESAVACGQFIAGFTVYAMSYGAWQSWWIETMWLAAALATVVYLPAGDAGEGTI